MAQGLQREAKGGGWLACGVRRRHGEQDESNFTWPKGTFVETVKEWKKLWFYIAEPRGHTWAATAEFNSGAPMRLTSWIEKGPNWSSSDELIALQTRI